MQQQNYNQRTIEEVLKKVIQYFEPNQQNLALNLFGFREYGVATKAITYISSYLVKPKYGIDTPEVKCMELIANSIFECFRDGSISNIEATNLMEELFNSALKNNLATSDPMTTSRRNLNQAISKSSILEKISDNAKGGVFIEKIHNIFDEISLSTGTIKSLADFYRNMDEYLKSIDIEIKNLNRFYLEKYSSLNNSFKPVAIQYITKILESLYEENKGIIVFYRNIFSNYSPNGSRSKKFPLCWEHGIQCIYATNDDKFMFCEKCLLSMINNDIDINNLLSHPNDTDKVLYRLNENEKFTELSKKYIALLNSPIDLILTFDILAKESVLINDISRLNDMNGLLKDAKVPDIKNVSHQFEEQKSQQPQINNPNVQKYSQGSLDESLNKLLDAMKKQEGNSIPEIFDQEFRVFVYIQNQEKVNALSFDPEVSLEVSNIKSIEVNSKGDQLDYMNGNQNLIEEDNSCGTTHYENISLLEFTA